MSDGVIQGGAMGIGKEELPDWRPCVVMALAEPLPHVAQQFRRTGWDVYLAESGPQLRRLVRLLAADLVVVDAALPDESGWLTCAKLREEWPNGRIVVLGEGDAREGRLAAFVGADVVVPYAEVMAVTGSGTRRAA
jgi:CheY-like chemotaxis protein